MKVNKKSIENMNRWVDTASEVLIQLWKDLMVESLKHMDDETEFACYFDLTTGMIMPLLSRPKGKMMVIPVFPSFDTALDAVSKFEESMKYLYGEQEGSQC